MKEKIIVEGEQGRSHENITVADLSQPWEQTCTKTLEEGVK